MGRNTLGTVRKRIALHRWILATDAHLLTLLIQLDTRDVVSVDAEVLLPHLLGVVRLIVSSSSLRSVRMRLRAM